jgi:cytochrome c biogenesis protein CcdA
MPIKEEEILLERYKTAIQMHLTHDTILWQQSSIFLLAEVTILGFGLTLTNNSDIFSVLKLVMILAVGLVLAGVWLFVNKRRQRFMETLESIKRNAASDLDKCLKSKGITLKYLPTQLSTYSQISQKRKKEIFQSSIFKPESFPIIDVDAEVHANRMEGNTRNFIVKIMPIAFVALFTIYIIIVLSFACMH